MHVLSVSMVPSFQFLFRGGRLERKRGLWLRTTRKAVVQDARVL